MLKFPHLWPEDYFTVAPKSFGYDLLILETSLFSVQDAPNSSWRFPASDLESDIPPRSHGFFFNLSVLKTQLY